GMRGLRLPDHRRAWYLHISCVSHEASSPQRVPARGNERKQPGAQGLSVRSHCRLMSPFCHEESPLGKDKARACADQRRLAPRGILVPGAPQLGRRKAVGMGVAAALVLLLLFLRRDALDAGDAAATNGGISGTLAMINRRFTALHEDGVVAG